MTPAQALASLERHLQLHGEDVTVRRYTAPTGTPRPKTDIAARAHVRAARADEMIGAIKQSQLRVIASPTGLEALLPIRTGDKVLIAGVEKNVEFASHIRVGDVLVRIELMVTG